MVTTINGKLVEKISKNGIPYKCFECIIKVGEQEFESLVFLTNEQRAVIKVLEINKGGK